MAIDCPERPEGTKGTESLNELGGAAIFPRIGLYIVAVVAVIFFSLSGPAEADTVAPANDAMENATVIRGDSASVSGNNESATRENGESDHIVSGSSMGQNSVWHRWTAWTSGPIKADVCRSNFDAIITVYTKGKEGELEQVADNDDACSAPNPRGGSLGFEAELEKTYWIAVSGYSKASSGNFILKLADLPPEP